MYPAEMLLVYLHNLSFHLTPAINVLQVSNYTLI